MTHVFAPLLTTKQSIKHSSSCWHFLPLPHKSKINFKKLLHWLKIVCKEKVSTRWKGIKTFFIPDCFQLAFLELGLDFRQKLEHNFGCGEIYELLCLSIGFHMNTGTGLNLMALQKIFKQSCVPYNRATVIITNKY